MTVRTRAQLKGDADTYLPDNAGGLISPEDVRERVKDIADSALLQEDIGASAGNVVALDGSGKLPALDGSQLTNLPGGTVPAAGAIGSHVIAASTDLVSGNNYPINTTVSGSSLVVCNTTPGTGVVFPLSARGVGQLDTISGGSSSLGYSGTWRLLSRVALGVSANSNYPMALFVRIA